MKGGANVCSLLTRSTPKQVDCLAKKRYLLESIELKLDSGLDRSINAIIGWVKIYLQNEQKKTDFKPETDDFDTLSSPVRIYICTAGEMMRSRS